MTQRTKAQQIATKAPVQTHASAKSVVPSAKPKASTVYKDFVRYDATRAPKWHPIKKMRYVFFRMIGGCTITDAINEIHWSPSEFWHLIDLRRNGPFRTEYQRAKQLQGRALADSVITIAEGRDRTSRASKRRMDKLVERALHKIARTKSPFKAKMMLQTLFGDLREHDKIIMTRNKLQVDAVKWVAGKVNPNEYGDKSTLSLGAPDGQSDKPKPLVIQFVGPDGKAVAL